jgi:hypothetical protein
LIHRALAMAEAARLAASLAAAMSSAVGFVTILPCFYCAGCARFEQVGFTPGVKGRLFSGSKVSAANVPRPHCRSHHLGESQKSEVQPRGGSPRIVCVAPVPRRLCHSAMLPRVG